MNYMKIIILFCLLINERLCHIVNEKLKDYYNLINNTFSIKHIFLNGLILALIIISIDAYNIPTNYFKNSKIFVLILIIIIPFIKFFPNLKNIKSKNINFIDYVNLISFIASITCLLYVLIFFKLCKFIMISVSLILENILLVILIYHKKIRTNENNVIDLKYICENKVNIENNKMIFIEDKEVSYDLFERSNVINQLYNSIIKCNPNETFTIGINGKWGIGKSTIVNNVIRIMKENKLNNYIIIKFDPWLYKDEESILNGLITLILNKINYNNEFFNYNIIIKEISKIIFDGKFDFIFNDVNYNLNNTFFYKIINNYLISNDKKMIIIIDNMDRVNKQIILFLLKCTELLINFKNTICILLYNEKIINNIIKEMFMIEDNYMDKIVQMKIDLNDTNELKYNQILDKVSNNIFMNGNKVINYKYVEKFKYNNIREFKKHINNILLMHCNINTNNLYKYLNDRDLFDLLYLKFNCSELFYEIWNNKRFYIYYDRYYSNEQIEFDIDKLNEEAKTYFINLDLKNKYKNYCDILKDMFPSVENFLNGKSTFFNMTVDGTKESTLNNRICNGKYFDLYFTGETNKHILLNNKTNLLIEKINLNENVYDLFNEQLNECVNNEEVKLYADILYLKVSNIKKEMSLNFIKIIYKNKEKYSNEILFLEINSERRFQMIISILLSNLTKKEFNNFKKTILTDYKNLYFFDDIKQIIKHNIEKGIIYDYNYSEIIDKMCKNIINNKINIFSDEFYHKGNMWSLYFYNKNHFSNYIRESVNCNNIYNFLAELISESYGTNNYGYCISKETMNDIPLSINEINYLILNHKSKLSNRENLIKEIYDKYNENNNNYKNTVYKEEYIEL